MTILYYVHYHSESMVRGAFLNHYRDVYVPHLLRFLSIQIMIMLHEVASADPHLSNQSRNMSRAVS